MHLVGAYPGYFSSRSRRKDRYVPKAKRAYEERLTHSKSLSGRRPMDSSKRLRVLNRATVTIRQLLDNERGRDALLYVLRMLRKTKIDSTSTEKVQLEECARLASQAVDCELTNHWDDTLAP
jgi:hypothetical protein